MTATLATGVALLLLICFVESFSVPTVKRSYVNSIRSNQLEGDAGSRLVPNDENPPPAPEQPSSSTSFSSTSPSPDSFESRILKSSSSSGCCSGTSSYDSFTLCSKYNVGTCASSTSTTSSTYSNNGCSEKGLSFIGYSFSVKTAGGNENSKQLCDQFPMEDIIDRNYEYAMSHDEDGWLGERLLPCRPSLGLYFACTHTNQQCPLLCFLALRFSSPVGGGYGIDDPSFKNPYIDSSHTELFRISSTNTKYNGVSSSTVISMMKKISFPPFKVYPEYVAAKSNNNNGGSGSTPYGDTELVVSVIAEYSSGSTYSEYALFSATMLSTFGDYACTDNKMTSPHVSMSRGTKFWSSTHKDAWVKRGNTAVARVSVFGETRDISATTIY